MHEVLLEPFGARGEGLTFVQCSDGDFVAGLLADLRTAEGRARVSKATVTCGPDEVLELFQPVHRIFHLTVAEVFCREPGLPRLDPAKLDGAGLVIRRVRVPRDDDDGFTEVHEAWVRRPDGTKGWRSLTPLSGDDLARWDPDPTRRRLASTGNDEVDRHAHERRRAAMLPERLALEGAEEAATTLFVAPPDVCKAAGRTLLFGLVPTASAETSTGLDLRYDDADLDAIVPEYLRAGPYPPDREPAVLPPDLQGRRLTRLDAERLEGGPFMAMLALLTVSLGAFPKSAGTPQPDSVEPLLAALERFTIAGRSGREFLADAARVLVWRDESSIIMPDAWPVLSIETARAIRDAMRPALEGQARRVVPDEGRFETAGARYVARAFVRVRRDDGCPPRLVWSHDSAPFQIKAWFASSPVPPLRVLLPELLPDRLHEALPNVAFVVPRGLAGFLNSNTAKSLLKGNGSKGKIGLDWICGFNIPIITLCAFIVLTIFLYLLNIIFWWLPIVKICVPIPRSMVKKAGLST